MSDEAKEGTTQALHKKACGKGKEFIVNFIKHPFSTAGDIVLYMIGLSVGLWLIFSVAHLCWNMLRPFFHYSW